MIMLTTHRPKEVAYRMIKDHLSLDGNPVLNLASFVTTYMVSTRSGEQMDKNNNLDSGGRGGKANG